MKELKQFNIAFIGLKQATHLFEYQITNKFFKDFNFDDFLDANVNATVTLVKKSTLLELTFTAKGTVNIPCDLTNEPFDQQIEATLPLIVKFGQEFNDESEEILILPHEAYQLNVAQYIYEMIVLAVPSKRIHPKVIDGTMESETLKKLKELEIKTDNTPNQVDPRWDKLKDLITEKKT